MKSDLYWALKGLGIELPFLTLYTGIIIYFLIGLFILNLFFLFSKEDKRKIGMSDYIFVVTAWPLIIIIWFLMKASS